MNPQLEHALNDLAHAVRDGDSGTLQRAAGKVVQLHLQAQVLAGVMTPLWSFERGDHDGVEE